MKENLINQRAGDTAQRRKVKRGERGYALVGLIGVMMFSLILMTATAPMVKMETQREREEEMLWRGQQISAALGRYAAMRGGQQFPTDLTQLIEGIDVGGKKIRLLRPSALCDPMTPCTPGMSNWRLVRPGDPLVKELYDAYLATQQKGNIALPPPPANLVVLAQMGTTRLPGQPADTQLDGNAGANDSGLSLDESEPGKGPIVGVVSRKSDRMFRSYYGIEYYDHSLFFPGVTVMAGGFIAPNMVIFSAASSPPGATGDCPKGGILVDGKCFGVLIPGKLCRGPDGKTVPCPGS